MEIQVRLKKLTFEGLARGRARGKKVLAWGGLPEETATCRVIRRQRGTLTGVVDTIQHPSHLRVAPVEEHYLSCSPWQVLDYAHEPAWKETLVRDMFWQKHGVKLPSFAVISGPPLRYRNKLEFSFIDTTDGVALAFYQRGVYHSKTPINGCALGAPAISDAARLIRDVLRETGVDANRLKSLMLRCNRRGQVVAGMYVTQSIGPVVDRVQERVAQCNNSGNCRDLGDEVTLTGLSVYLSNPQSPASVVSSILERFGSPILEETVLGQTFRFCDRSFFQVNVPLFEAVLRDIARHAAIDQKHGRVYDLYAGVGVIGLSLCSRSPSGERVVFVESDESSAAFLRENCRAAGAHNVEIHHAPVEKAITEIPPGAVLLLDPPRAGLHPKVLKRLLASPPRRVVYLSCNPAAQARELVLLLAHYQLKFFRAYNFFPRTPHVETLAILDRR